MIALCQILAIIMKPARMRERPGAQRKPREGEARDPESRPEPSQAQGVGPGSGEAPEGRGGHQQHTRKTEKSKRPTSFFADFWAVPAAASCPAGKTAPKQIGKPMLAVMICSVLLERS